MNNRSVPFPTATLLPPEYRTRDTLKRRLAKKILAQLDTTLLSASNGLTDLYLRYHRNGTAFSLLINRRTDVGEFGNARG